MPGAEELGSIHRLRKTRDRSTPAPFAYGLDPADIYTYFEGGDFAVKPSIATQESAANEGFALCMLRDLEPDCPSINTELLSREDFDKDD